MHLLGTRRQSRGLRGVQAAPAASAQRSFVRCCGKEVERGEHFLLHFVASAATHCAKSMARRRLLNEIDAFMRTQPDQDIAGCALEGMGKARHSSLLSSIVTQI